MRIFLAVLISMTIAGPAAGQAKPAVADVIFIHGNIYPGASTTFSQADSQTQSMNRFQAIAVSGGRVMDVGANETMLKLKRPHTRVIDLGGRFVMPGFNDAHTHLANGGFEKLNVNLVGSKSLEEMKQRIAARAKATGPGEWLIGRGWDHTLWTNQTLPDRHDLDAVTAGHPAIFVRVDGHIAVASSAALKAMKITAQTPDPQGGKIDHEAGGGPSGILRETAKDRVLARLPRPTPAQRRKAAKLALQDAAQWGLTSAQDNSDWEDFLVFEELEKEGKLTLRISEWLAFDTSVEQLKQMRAHHRADDRMLHTGMLKGYMDGSLGSRTAAMLAPYTDDPENSGLARYDQETLNRMAAERAQAGFQIGFHAIGDRGARMALDAFAYAEKQSSRANLRFRIEHDQVLAKEDIQRFASLGVIASMQANHLLTDMNWAESRIGPERAKHSYPWKEFLYYGAPLAFGTDYPVEPITPFRGLYAAVTRKNPQGTKEYYPEQKLTIDEAIAAYTTTAARAEFAEEYKGTLAPGMVADFVVLDRDITRIEPAEILKTKVLRTVLGGKTVYEAK
ncbi:MAG TPA: amidohydrolase family protein [Candidatus Saccharimonadales bacterium]|jgi:predicted amidohydrolase YtcJ|nr:amidohydrolase family protein [Candidatus Saccharimonadales bacterium]